MGDLVDEQFLKSLPADPIAAAHAVCKLFFRMHTAASERAREFEEPYSEEEHKDHLEILALFESLSEAYALGYKIPVLTGKTSDNIIIVRDFFHSIAPNIEKHVANKTVEAFRSKFSSAFKRGFVYEFSEGDLTRVQSLVNELRKLIAESKDFEDDHRRRLLRRLEVVQAELHKKMSDLDRLWGLIGEAGVVIGKFGNDVKPIVDRIKELTFIVWLTQARAEGLPSDCVPPIPHLTVHDDKDTLA